VEELRRRLQDSERENEMLSNNINNLNREIEKKELTILLQGKVIKLLDDSSQTLQRNIEEQIAAQSFDSDSAASLP
jgi:intracellular sulfur oxidation DsrE/DsrF family protein